MHKNDSNRNRMTSLTWNDVRETICDADELARIERHNEVMRKLLARKNQLTISDNNNNNNNNNSCETLSLTEPFFY